MPKPGRKSAAELATTSIPTRPEPPNDLNEEESIEWKAVVNRLPVDWFKREHYGVLVAYCQHVVLRRFIKKLIDGFPPEDLQTKDGVSTWAKLHSALSKETEKIVTCARTMRITHQAVYNAKSGHTKISNGGNRSPRG